MFNKQKLILAKTLNKKIDFSKEFSVNINPNYCIWHSYLTKIILFLQVSYDGDCYSANELPLEGTAFTIPNPSEIRSSHTCVSGEFNYNYYKHIIIKLNAKLKVYIFTKPKLFGSTKLKLYLVRNVGIAERKITIPKID